MSGTSLFYWQDQLGKVNPQVLRLTYDITGAKTSAPVPQNSATLVLYDAVASQAVINDFLGTVDEFTAAQYDGTSMGADALGVIINMNGQAAQVVQMVAKCYSASNTLVTRQSQSGTLAASTLETLVECGADGNIGCKINFGNSPDFDGLTDGTIELEIYWISK